MGYAIAKLNIASCGGKVRIEVMQKRPIWVNWLAVIVGIWVAMTVAAAPAVALSPEQKLLSEVWRIVNRAYIDETFNHQNWWWVRERALRTPLQSRDETYEAIREMLAGLGDPFTRFLNPEQYRSLQTNTSGELTGVGLQIALDADTGELMVVAPIAGSPADRAGIHPQDRIVAIDHVPTQSLTLDGAAARMRGTVGSAVQLTIRSENGQEQVVSLVRDRIEINPVIAELDRREGLAIGYLRLTQFNGNAPTELAAAIRRLQTQGAEAFVLDLRNNPGGLLQAGIAIARQWLDEGVIVYTVNRQGILDSFEATDTAITDAPLVVLVNRGTASASEILSGALQDNGRAQLVGERTFGKGLIQSLFDLSDGSGIAVTIAKYETPNHRDINQAGITPDVTVELPREEPSAGGMMGDRPSDPQYQAAIKLLGQRLQQQTTSQEVDGIVPPIPATTLPAVPRRSLSQSGS